MKTDCEYPFGFDGKGDKRVAVSMGVFALLLVLFVGGLSPSHAKAENMPVGEMWICPSVSTNTDNGMWVVGAHGTYYILKPGTRSPVWPGILAPTAGLEAHAPFVEDKAQISAGWGLYKDLPTYPYFEGTAMVLQEGVEEFGLQPGWQYISAEQQIPLAAAVFW